MTKWHSLMGHPLYKWRIWKPVKSQNIEIFLDEIRIFYNDETRDCYKDEILSIYQASDSNPKNKLIKQICGDSTTMAPVRTNSNYVTIEFTTGNYKKNWKPSHSKEWNGFYIYYQTYTLWTVSVTNKPALPQSQVRSVVKEIRYKWYQLDNTLITLMNANFLC